MFFGEVLTVDGAGAVPVAHRQGDGSVRLGGPAVYLGVGGVVVLRLQDELLALAPLHGHMERLPHPGRAEKREEKRRGDGIKMDLSWN